ncbi:hypothetical protein GNY06_00260 [Elizabethkingia argentiflava]|uniref:SprT-like domain-containing protein n=1 Tax=Elizabethkingia argenteiflava TaxID=2681556 RepID=A0A845PQI9_9FLAO|nr:hypothetical protein [Elizabethkingia argenteiflava]NAW49895.1 hypothetical protein [Elizabethkingia argenteiflava]
MKLKLLLNLLVFFALFISLNSCRTEDNVLENKNSKALVNNQKILDMDVDNAIQYTYYNDLNLKNNKYLTGKIEFRLRSNLIKYEDGDRGIIYPVVKNNKVESILLGILNTEGKKVNFFELKDKEYEKTKNIFSVQYDINKRKLNNINFIASENKFCAELPEDICRALGIPIDPVNITKPKKPVNPLFPEDLPVPFKPGIFETPADMNSADIFIIQNINDSQIKNNKCANAVYQKLKSKGGLFNNLLGKFNKKNIVKLSFEIKKIPSTKGFVLGYTDQSNVKNGLLTISINSEALASSELGIAKTFVHEMLHAKMFLDLINSGWKGDPDLIRKINPSTLPTLLEEYRKNAFGSEIPQHEFMSKFYIKKLTNALAQFDELKQDRSVYENLAWTGLEGTEMYKSFSQSKKDEVAKVRDANYKRGTCTK